MITPILNYKFNHVGYMTLLLLAVSTSFLFGNGNNPCTAVAAQNAGHAIWLSKYHQGKHANFYFDDQGGKLEENEDATAHVYGIIYNKKDPQDQWEVQLWLSNRMNWDEWSALGRKYKDQNNKADDLYKTWSYYIMDPDKNSMLVGKGKNEGTTVPIKHNPIDYSYGFQVGQAANDKNKHFGMSGWFLYFLDGDKPRQGDFNFDLSCETNSPNDCPECFSTSLLNSSVNDEGNREYTLEVSNDGSCRHALSHYTIALPCGTITDVHNSEGWKVEIGKDPTTGLNGLKIDDISGFGDANQPGNFTVTFSISSDDPSCTETLNSWEANIAYKAGQCITTETMVMGEEPGGVDESECNVNDLAVDFITTDLSCASAQDGSIKIEIIGGVAPFTFAWSNGATTQDLTGLGGGNYSVTITDTNEAFLQLSGTVFEPTLLAVQGMVSPVTCGATNGTISLMVSGGTSPYSYSWSNGSNERDLSGLTADTYVVLVTDVNGCSVNQEFVLLATSDLSVTISANSCNDGSLVADIVGGVPPYSYSWSTGETTNDIKVAATGTYEVSVTDVNGCSAASSVTVNDLTTFELTVETTIPSCGGISDGAIDLTVTGGQAPFTYSWSNGETTQDLSNVASGNYTVTVTDARGCNQQLTHFLRNPISIFITAKVDLIRCDGDGADGAINISIFNAAEPYNVSWSNGATSEDISSLAPGVYTLTVTDANGCQGTKTIKLTAPEDFEVDLTQQYCGDGRICPTLNGGSGPFTYIWTDEGGNSISTIDGCIDVTEAGTYTVQVIDDANGCIKSASITVGAPNPSLSSSLSVSDVTCAGGSDGTASVSITGGDGNYTILWSNGMSTQSISGLVAKSYTVKVTDGNGCQEFRAFNVQEPQGLEISAIAFTEVSCNGESDGAIDIMVVNGTAPYSYQWSDGSTSEDLANVGADTYSVTVSDANGCSAVMSYDLMVDPDNTTCDNGNGDGGNTGGGDGTGGDGNGDGNGDGTADPCIRDCNTCDGKITELTLKYLGDEPNAQIMVKQKNGGQVVFDEIVAPEGEFSFTGTDNKGSLSSEIIISINGIEETTIHTSCSQPIGPGLIAGAFEVVEGESRNGGALCPIDPNTQQEQEQQQEEEPQGEDCSECHESELISITETTEGCITYTIEVFNNGSCAHALSHYSIRVPCGIVTEASNSRGWKMELNSKDLHTNLYGLKVDDIHGFGENGQSGSFTVTYTVCPNQDNECKTKLQSENIIVGYKAAQCAKIETIELNDQVANFDQEKDNIPLTFIKFSVYPNPFKSGGSNSLNLEFQEANIGEKLSVKVMGVTGKSIYTKRLEITRENQVLPLQMAGISPGVYFVTITSHNKVYTEKIIIK